MHEKNQPPVAAAPTPGASPAFNRAAWARILPFVTYLSFLAIAGVLERLGWNPHDLRWLYPVKTAAVVLVLAYFWRDYGELHKARLGLAAAVAAAVTGVVVLVLWVSLDANWMVIGAPAGFNPVTDGRIDWLMVAVRIFGAALVVPVMEELFWRSFLMRWIESPDFQSVDPAQVGWKGLVVTIVLFGFEHNLWLAGMVAGVAYSILYMRHRSLWSPILAHAVTNGLLGIWVVHTGSWTFW